MNCEIVELKMADAVKNGASLFIDESVVHEIGLTV